MNAESIKKSPSLQIGKFVLSVVLFLSMGSLAADDKDQESAVSRDLDPLLSIDPQYPRAARINQVEGYVLVEFELDTDGNVRNPVLLESVPPRVFDTAAIRAILRFKYPKGNDGTSLQYRFNFELES